MNPLHNPLDGFDPALYVATLAEVAHSDGLHPSEEALLRGYADTFGLHLDNLPEVPRDLSGLPWSTRVLVYRDAVVLAQADNELSSAEEDYLHRLAERMKLPPATATAVGEWVRDYDQLLDRLSALLDGDLEVPS